jgi:hypothetical protein
MKKATWITTLLASIALSVSLYLAPVSNSTSAVKAATSAIRSVEQSITQVAGRGVCCF